MFLFASGRTDIPAFYSEWFVNRLKAGFVDVRNPYHNQQVTRYCLSPELVDCIIYCTKNPEPILKYIDEIKRFGTYFFVTITPYGTEIEPNVPDKNLVIENFCKLSAALGKEKVCWRYDPIFINEVYSAAFHIKAFRKMCESLSPYTSRCIISFIDLYEKTKKNFNGVQEVSEKDQRFLAGAFSSIAKDYGITIETCAEKIDLSSQGVLNGGCISKNIIEAATGINLKINTRSTLRQHCNCLPTRDLGYYNSCPHLCRYCYANYDENLVKSTYARHNPQSSFLIGESLPDDIIHIADQKSYRDPQQRLFL